MFAFVEICNAPGSVLCRLERFPPNPHNNNPRTPTRHNVLVATHTVCGWNCDNITTVLDGTHKRTYTTTTHRVKSKRYNTKIQITTEANSIRVRIRIQIGLRVLKINEGTISLPRPSRRDSQANVVRLQTYRLHWNSSPEGVSTINSTVN